MRLDALDHVALFVADQARSARWYQDVLGLERVHEKVWGSYPIVLVARDRTSGVALFPANAPATPGAQRAPLRFAHVAFRAGRAAFDEAREALRAKGIAFEEQDHLIARSLYVLDPDGHQVEVTTYEV